MFRLHHEKEKLSHVRIQNWSKLFCKEKRWDVLTAVLCNKRCIRKLQFVVHTKTDLNKNTIHLIYDFGHFKIYWISALCSFVAPTRTPLMCWILTGCSGSPELPIRVCLWLAHTDICGTRDSSKSNRPTLAKISCPSVMFSRDKWMEARWLCMESLHWSRLVIPDIPLKSPQRSLRGRDRKHDILFSDRYLFNLICQTRRQKFNHARKLGFSQD